MTVTYSAYPVISWTLKTDPPTFILIEPFKTTWKRDGKPSFSFIVDAGFTTDLASIPRIFRSLIPQVGRHLQPAIAHDWIYGGNVDMSKEDADLMFLDGMKSTGVWWLRRRVMYLAVRIGGKGYWE
jgi:hypothetical protein